MGLWEGGVLGQGGLGHRIDGGPDRAAPRYPRAHPRPGPSRAFELFHGLGRCGAPWASPDWQQVSTATRTRIAGHLARGEASHAALRANRSALEWLVDALAQHRAFDEREVAAPLWDVVARVDE